MLFLQSSVDCRTSGACLIPSWVANDRVMQYTCLEQGTSGKFGKDRTVLDCTSLCLEISSPTFCLVVPTAQCADQYGQPLGIAGHRTDPWSWPSLVCYKDSQKNSQVPPHDTTTARAEETRGTTPEGDGPSRVIITS